MKGLGHFPMSESPAEFLRHLLPVLDKIGKMAAKPAQKIAGAAECRNLIERDGPHIYPMPTY
jgi:hypothetical protein